MTRWRSAQAYTRAELLLIDEMGLEQGERDGARRSGFMQKMLLPRYNEQRSTIITSNIPWEGWKKHSATISCREVPSMKQ